MTPRHSYHSLLALATKHRNRKRGKKLCSYRYIRLHPDNPQAVQVGWWFNMSYPVQDPKTGRDAFKEIDQADQPFIALITLHADHAIIDPYTAHQTYPPELPPAVAAKYPGIKVRHRGPYKRVDIGLNNLIWRCGLNVRHDAATTRHHPGFTWSVCAYNSSYGGLENRTQLYGPVRYDYASRTFSAVKEQPVREVKEDLRKQLNTRLRAAFKRLRLLSRLGVSLSVDDYLRVVGYNDIPLSTNTPDGTAFIARCTELGDIKAFVDRLEHADFEDREQVEDLAVRAAFVLTQSLSWYRASARQHLAVVRDRADSETGLICDESTLTSLRRIVHDAFAVSTYRM